MANRSYRIGYNFERRVRKFLQSQYPQGIIIRQGKSSFPDLWLLLPNGNHAYECKVNKYLSKEEKEKAKYIKDRGFPFTVVYREGHKMRFLDI